MTVNVKVRKMSMYGELLEASLQSVEGEDDADDRGRERELLVELAHCRRQLGTGPIQVGRPGSPDASSSIAAQLDYDLVLIRLCRLHGIDCAPAGFTRPLIERRRLENALKAAGVDFDV